MKRFHLCSVMFLLFVLSLGSALAQENGASGKNGGGGNTLKGQKHSEILAQIREDLTKIESRLDGIDRRIEESKLVLGSSYWPPNPVIFGIILFLIVLAFVLHLLHLLRISGINHNLHRLAAQQNLTNRVGVVPGKNPTIETPSDQLKRQGQVLEQLSNRVKQMEGRFTVCDSNLRDASHAVALTAAWIGQAQLREAYAADGENVSEAERASTISTLERYLEPMRLNASRVEPVSQSLAEVVEWLEDRKQVSQELFGKVRSLYEGIGRFDQSHRSLRDQLIALRRGSFSERNSMLQSEQERLRDQVNNGSLSVAQMVQKSRALLDHYFPEQPRGSIEETLPLPERESKLKNILIRIPDYLMDWYNSLYQLQSQLGQMQGKTENELASELTKVQQIAREALGKFDIQPETIQIGQASYDRRLHDAALVRQAAQYPINTIIEVHECGFRRMSTGEVLRRPQVVVSGAAGS